MEISRHTEEGRTTVHGVVVLEKGNSEQQLSHTGSPLPCSNVSKKNSKQQELMAHNTIVVVVDVAGWLDG